MHGKGGGEVKNGRYGKRRKGERRLKKGKGIYGMIRGELSKGSGFLGNGRGVRDEIGKGMHGMGEESRHF